MLLQSDITNCGLTATRRWRAASRAPLMPLCAADDSKSSTRLTTVCATVIRIDYTRNVAVQLTTWSPAFFANFGSDNYLVCRYEQPEVRTQRHSSTVTRHANVCLSHQRVPEIGSGRQASCNYLYVDPAHCRCRSDIIDTRLIFTISY